MKYKFLLVLAFLALVGFANSQPVGKRQIVTGRVVDEVGNPITKAAVTLLTTAAPSSNCLAESHLTDDRGQFRIETDASSPDGKYTLYVSTGMPAGVEAPLTPPFPKDLQKVNGSFKGKIITLKKGETNVGDVPVQVQYEVVSVNLQDSKGYVLTESKTPDVLYRVRDTQGDVIARGTIPSARVKGSNSVVRIALPRGMDNLEIAVGGDSGAWQSLAKTPTAVVTAPVRLDDPSSFIERAKKGNTEAVESYLNAGEDPNARDEAGNTALIVAAQDNAAVVKALLQRSFDVNATNNEGNTALMVAASAGNFEVVKALLVAGANVNAKAKNGVTALIAASGNGHGDVVDALLVAGADVQAQDENGFTALSIAEQTSNKGIAHLLKKFGAQK